MNKIQMISNWVKKNGKQVTLYLGEVTKLSQIGQGGNSLVFTGEQNGKEIALKFLVESRESKLLRFKAEYFNVKNLNNNDNIVKYLNYEEVIIEEEVIPVIIMKKYKEDLKRYRKNKDVLEEKDIKKLFNFLLDVLELIHEEGIFHRDIKPENILVTEDNDFVLADFGIASFDPERFKLKAETQKGERMANFEFSAPEQSVPGVVPAATMDIYSLGQLCQWYVFGEPHKGTERKSFTEKYESLDIKIIDFIINKCLNNDPNKRFLTILEIRKEIQVLKDRFSKVDPFDEMLLLNRSIRETCPSVGRGIQGVEDEKYIKRLIENINTKRFKKELWFNTGIGNNSITSLKYLNDNRILIDESEFKVKKLWLYAGDSLYDDVLMIEVDKNIQPFVINDREFYSAVIIDEEVILEPYYYESGYIEINDEVKKLSEIDFEYRVKRNDYKFILIGTEYNCTIIEENDSILRYLQDSDINDSSDLSEFIKKIRSKKHREVYLRM